MLYLTEHDPAQYTLAEMVNDVALLNTRMLHWMRDLPELLAVMIDPIAAWHRVIENNNIAMGMLCSSLRGVAVQGKRHIGLDHHVTKVAQFDPEGHVGNLAALRGGGIGADARWVFTMAALRPETAMSVGIPEADRWRYRRLDPLKASYRGTGEQMRLLRVASVPIANGETAGVLVEVDMDFARMEAKERQASAEQRRKSDIANALTQMLLESRPRSARGAADWVAGHAPELFKDEKGKPLSTETIRRRWPTTIGRGIDTKVEGRFTQIVMRENTKGKGSEIDFADKDLAT